MQPESQELLQVRASDHSQELVAAGRESSRVKCIALSQGVNIKPHAESDGAAFLLQSWSPMNKQSRPQRPHTFRTLEELERQAHKFTGKTVSPLVAICSHVELHSHGRLQGWLEMHTGSFVCSSGRIVYLPV